MAYTKTTWVNGGAPGINATRLNNMETGIEAIDTLIVATAAANKVLKLNGDSKLPASITGDADTVDGKHAADFQSATRVSGSAAYTDTINASSTVTKSIAIGSGKKFGMAILSGYTAGGATTAASYRSVLVLFDTKQTGAFIVGGYDDTSAGWGKGSAWTRSKLGKITNAYKEFGMYVAGLDNYSYVADLYISGTNLVVTYGNTNASASQQIGTTIEWVVW